MSQQKLPSTRCQSPTKTNTDDDITTVSPTYESKTSLPGEPLNCNLDFYWTVASGSSRKAIREAQQDGTIKDHGQEINLDNYSKPAHAMVSFETRNNKPWHGPKWFIDSGGYSALQTSVRAKHETSAEDYVDYLLKHLDRGIDIRKWALRDWPYDKDILRKHERDIRDHQRWTTRDHIRCLEIADDYGLLSRENVEPVPVLQGRDINDYLWHLDYLRDHGLLVSSTIGIGSLVSRNDVTETRSLIEQIREELPDKYSIHGFGIKKRTLNNPNALKLLDSVDTAAWSYGSRMAAETNPNTRNTWIQNIKAYEAYRNRLEEVFQDHGRGNSATITLLNSFHPSDSTVGQATSHPLMECLCGTIIDWNAIADGEDYRAATGEPCRHCERTLTNLYLARDGLLCDPEPEINNHHPLCPHNDTA